MTTGEKVDNARLAKIAGVKNIRRAAMNAIEEYYDCCEEVVKVKDFKVIKKDGEKLTEGEKEVEKYLDEDHLNDNMTIGITNKGELFFIIRVATYYDTGFENRIIDSKGNVLNLSDNKNYIGSGV